jgi:hypothetical protein
MNLYQKIILALGAIALLWAVFTVPMRDIVVNNPKHVPYSKSTTAYVSETVPDYNLMFLRAFGVVGATGVAYMLVKTMKKGNTCP